MSTSGYETDSISAKIDSFFTDAVASLDVPVIDSRENCVTVGPFRVITNGPDYEVRRGKTMIATFARRAWAAAYALRLFQGDKSAITALEAADTSYRKLDEERARYLHHINFSQRSENWIRGQIFEDRLSRVESEIEVLNQRVNPILKYSRM